jgi:hypothetical protein
VANDNDKRIVVIWFFNGTVPTPDVIQRRMEFKQGIIEVYLGRICQETVTIYKTVASTLHEGTRENAETARILASFWPRLESGTFRIGITELATICELHSYENSGLITDPTGSSADQQQRHSIQQSSSFKLW